MKRSSFASGHKLGRGISMAIINCKICGGEIGVPPNMTMGGKLRWD